MTSLQRKDGVDARTSFITSTFNVQYNVFASFITNHCIGFFWNTHSENRRYAILERCSLANSMQHSIAVCRPFIPLSVCHTPVLWLKLNESSMTGAMIFDVWGSTGRSQLAKGIGAATGHNFMSCIWLPGTCGGS